MPDRQRCPRCDGRNTFRHMQTAASNDMTCRDCNLVYCGSCKRTDDPDKAALSARVQELEAEGAAMRKVIEHGYQPFDPGHDDRQRRGRG